MILGMGAALALLDEVGVARIAGQITAWLAEAEQALAAAGLSPGPPAAVRRGILTFRPKTGSAEDFVNRARQAGLVLSPRRSRVRVSPHFYNGEHELRVLVDFARA